MTVKHDKLETTLIVHNTDYQFISLQRAEIQLLVRSPQNTGTAKIVLSQKGTVDELTAPAATLLAAMGQDLNKPISG